jgi:hypothetical protein
MRSAMLGEIGVDAAIEFFDIPKLIEAVEDAVSKQLNTGQWRFLRKVVHYISKHELIQIDHVFDRIFAKDKVSYGTQAKYRLVLIPEHNFPGKNESHLFLYLDDVAKFAKRIA